MGPGLGRATLLLPALATVTKARKSVAWMAANDRPYPPALLQAGVVVDRVLIVDAGDHRQRLWWAEETWLRDYYQATSIRGERLWIYRQQKQWFLHGHFG